MHSGASKIYWILTESNNLHFQWGLFFSSECGIFVFTLDQHFQGASFINDGDLPVTV